MPQLTVRDFMTADPITIDLHTSVSAARRIMLERRIRHLPVVSGDHLLGVVSERDINLVATLKPDEVDTLRVEDAMTSDPFTVTPSTSIDVVARTMADYKYGAVVVVDQGKVVGVFTTVDALRALCSLLGKRGAPLPAAT